ncbi:hypothetical protein NBRC116188_21690 [Oceaniserpentilla sp. 4NH20-0058]|uniref:hypothetical protein n=1 Tax=Oceaniserpentilla sp. 4NH20-0058 TaxID=3127660 RepID=UPI0031072B2E
MKLHTKTKSLAKKIYTLSLLATLAMTPLPAFTQGENDISRLVPFQGRLHNAEGEAVSDDVYDITFNIYATPTGGTPVWTESHNNVSVIHGYVNVLLGAINPMHSDDFSHSTPAYDCNEECVDFTTKTYLGISIGGGAEMFPRSQLVPSFHAFTSNHADHATRADDADNADKLGGLVANTYAQIDYVDSEIADANSDVTSLSTRTASLESKFTGAKARDAEKLDNVDSSGFMRQEFVNGHYGLTAGGNSGKFIRTSQKGFIPYQPGGHGNLGTSDWPFNIIQANDIYDNGVILENKYLGKNAKAASAIQADNAAKLGGQNINYFRNASNINSGQLNVNRIPTGGVDNRGVLKRAKYAIGVSDCGISNNCGYYWDKNTGFITIWGMVPALVDTVVVTYPQFITGDRSVNATLNVTSTVSHNGGWDNAANAHVYGFTQAGFTLDMNDSAGNANVFWRVIAHKAVN